MRKDGRTWVVVLAGGEGSRLREFTTRTDGVSVPKQYCSIVSERSLLQETLQRAVHIADPECVVTIVAESHRRWWHPLSLHLQQQNLIVQPRSRGTAYGILLPTLQILERDPNARIVFMPSDHYVCGERTLLDGIRHAVEHLDSYRREIVLLGISPHEPDPELGYILPGPGDTSRFHFVRQFIEKPSACAMAALLQRGALWNSFIFAVKGQALLSIFERRFGQATREMVRALRRDSRDSASEALENLYSSLPDHDFSRDVVMGCETLLRVLKIPECGWCDLGTPARIASCLKRLPFASHRTDSRKSPVWAPAYLNCNEDQRDPDSASAH